MIQHRSVHGYTSNSFKRSSWLLRMACTYVDPNVEMPNYGYGCTPSSFNEFMAVRMVSTACFTNSRSSSLSEGGKFSRFNIVVPSIVNDGGGGGTARRNTETSTSDITTSLSSSMCMPADISGSGDVGIVGSGDVGGRT